MTIDLDAIKARAEAATEGPWMYGQPADDCEETCAEWMANTATDPDGPATGLWTAWTTCTSCTGVLITSITGDGPTSRENAEFIAHAREDVPMLVAEVERLRAERDRARELAARLEEQVAAADDLAAKVAEGEASDGYHTHRELYEYRMLYNALAVAVDNRMMATAKPAEIWAALRGEGACEGSSLCPGGTHTEGCYSLAWTDEERQQCTDARRRTPCTECARAALAEAHVAEFERLRAVVTRMEALADWHETKADKAMLFPGDGNVLIADKAATVHRDAAARLRAALTEAGGE